MITRKLIGITICIILVMASGVTAFADEPAEIVYFDDGSYLETVIEEEPQLLRATQTKTASKITRYKNSSGATMWYVKVTGTFRYNGSTSSCTDSTITAAAPDPTWSIKSKSSSKSGSTAKATATAVQKENGTTTNTMTKSVSLTCNKNGSLS